MENRGGYREGSGRPSGTKKESSKVPWSTRIAPDLLKWLKAQVNQAKIIDDALRNYIKRKKE